MKNKILLFNDYVYDACIWISGIAIFAMSMIIPYSIFARFVLGTGASWPEPIAVLLMVVFTFFGAAAAYRAKAHIAVAMVTDKLPKVLQGILANLIKLLMLAVACFMLIYGAQLCMATMNQSIGQMPWMPVGVTYLPVPIGGFLTLIFVLEHIVFGSQDKREVVTFDHEKTKVEAI